MKLVSHRLWRPVAASIALLLPLAAVGGTASAQTLAACPDVTVTVAAPAADAPTTVSVSIEPEIPIKPAADADPASFHLHYFVDTEAVAAGTLVPAGDPQVIHSASTSVDLGALTPGEHTVTVVVGQMDHTACDARGTVSFTVEDAAPAPAPTAPATGNAGLLPQASSSVLASMLLATVAIAGAVVARRMTAKS